MRFTFTADAEIDIDEITRYLQSLPRTPALKVGRQLQKAIALIIDRPDLGRVDERLTSRSSRRILRFVFEPYILFYDVDEGRIRIIGILHGKRDVDQIMKDRIE